MRYAYDYDAMGRMIRKSASGRTLLAMAYDRNGNKIRQTDVSGKVTEYAYSPLDLLEKVWDDGKELAAYDYNADGTIHEERHGPLHKRYWYDLDKNLTGLTVHSGDTLLARNSYAYDGNGNRTLKRQLGGETLYHYDPLNQLTKVEYPGYTEELFYDKAGNRTRRMVRGVEELYQYDPRNRLMALTKGGVTTHFLYDNAGNLLTDDKARYSYDAFNRTTKVETFDGNIQLNRYDAEGLRYEMEENGNLVQFIFNQEREVVTEEDNTGLTRLIRSTELIARSTDAVRTYYHYASDEMGSTTHIVDDEGQVQNRYEYDAWGNITAQEEAVPNRFKFTGQQLDPVTQQYYLRARFYNPVIARFTQEDTYRGDGLNLYAYCANNPIYYVDPTGYEKSSVWGTDDKGRATYTDASGKTYKQDAQGNWHDESGKYCSDPTGTNRPAPPQIDSNTAPHGNSKNSTKPNHVYVIVDQSGTLIKVGISGQVLNKNGSSPRANPQVAELNRQGVSARAIIIETGLTRIDALALEQKITDKHAARNGGQMPSPYHQRPNPTVSSIEEYIHQYGESPNKSTGGRY